MAGMKEVLILVDANHSGSFDIQVDCVKAKRHMAMPSSRVNPDGPGIDRLRQRDPHLVVSVAVG